VNRLVPAKFSIKGSYFAFILTLSLVLVWKSPNAQVLNAGQPFYEELIRRLDVAGELDNDLSFLIRPLDLRKVNYTYLDSLLDGKTIYPRLNSKNGFLLVPFQVSYRYNPSNLTAYGDRMMVPTAGHQTYLSAGFFAKLGILNVQFQPEFVLAQNAPFEGYSDDFNPSVALTRFIYWNNGDYPERFGDGKYQKLWWGQSKISLTGKYVELYAGTQNIHWGPGQFNSLIFGKNAPGFTHLSLNTVKPVKTFIGSFEAQVLMGRLENSFFEPSQQPELNERFYIPVESDWRYLNAFTFTYNPKWTPGLYFGINRTFQVNNNLMGNSLDDYFPVFQFFQKEKVIDDGNTLVYDNLGTDQQVSIFTRIVAREAKAEIYFEFGRRDHSYNWREFILNPEHARAYLLGFQKLIPVRSSLHYIQVRGEMVQQQESVNRYIRYVGLGGNLTWHTHGTARGFSNEGQALGVGIGTGSNSQVIEVAYVSPISKMGALFSRIENNEDFFYRAFGLTEENNPWVDFGLSLLMDRRWDDFTLASKLTLVSSQNRQWKSYLIPSEEFKKSETSFNAMFEVDLLFHPWHSKGRGR